MSEPRTQMFCPNCLIEFTDARALEWTNPHWRPNNPRRPHGRGTWTCKQGPQPKPAPIDRQQLAREIDASALADKIVNYIDTRLTIRWDGRFVDRMHKEITRLIEQEISAILEQRGIG